VVIGKKGEDIEVLKADLRRMLGVQMVHVNIEEIRKPEIDAQLIADSIAQQLEKRIMFRRAMKRAMQNAMRLGAQGIKIASSGRLNGIEIARNEWYREGRVPLHTLRADIDYGFGEAKTTYGVIGIKVWVYKGETAAKIEQPSAVPGSAPDEAPQPKKVRKAPAPAGKTEAQAAKPDGEAQPKAATRARKKPATEVEANDGDAAKTEAKVDGSTEESAKPAAKAKTTVRRAAPKKTGV
jgi:small subunit ribosomal protein S3